MAFERNTTADQSTGLISDAPWIADLESLIYLEAGAAITDTNFPAGTYPNGVPSGTLVHVEAGEVKPGASATFPTGLTRYPWDPSARGVGSSGTMSVVVGGVIHVDKLPVMPRASDLPATFVKQNDSGKAYTA